MPPPSNRLGLKDCVPLVMVLSWPRIAQPVLVPRSSVNKDFVGLLVMILSLICLSIYLQVAHLLRALNQLSIFRTAMESLGLYKKWSHC